MAIQKNLNVSPYYDDYDPKKNFYQILYKAGFPIQARELTQQQSIIQNQLEGLASRFLTEGDNVVPGETQYEAPAAYVRLSSITQGASVQDYVGYELKGATSGVVAIVNFAVDKTDDDDVTFYVTYGDAGTSTTTDTFDEGEILESTNPNGITATVGVNGISKPITSTPLGQGALFRVTEGSYFIDGMIIRNDDQQIIVSKYNSRPTAKIGFLVTEEIITSSEDPSILDNSQGSSNFAAPGADRLKITLTLVVRELDSVDPNFITLRTLNQGNILATPKETVKWDWLYDVLARRTFDESGDYIVSEFPIVPMEYWNDGTEESTGLYTPDENTGLYPNVPGSTLAEGQTPGLTYQEADNFYVLNASPGKAYVRGYEVEYTQNAYLYGSKSRNFQSRTDAVTQITEGYNLTITNTFGTPDFANISGEGTSIAFDDVVIYRNFIDGFVGEGIDANGRPLNTGNAPWKTFHIIANTDIGTAPTGFVEVYKEGNTAVVNSSQTIQRGDVIGSATVLAVKEIDNIPAGVMRPRYLSPNDTIDNGDGFNGYNSTYNLGIMTSVYFTELAVVGVTNSGTEWVVGNLVFGEESGAVGTVEGGSTTSTLLVSNVVGDFIPGEEITQGDKVSRILKDGEVSGFVFTDAGSNSSTFDLSAQTSVVVSALGTSKTLTTADGEIVAFSDRIEITETGRSKLVNFPSAAAVSGGARVDYQVVTSPSNVRGYATSRGSTLTNTLNLTKSFYSPLADTADFSADISIQNQADSSVFELANSSSFRGVADSNFLECNNFSGDPSLQLVAGDIVTFIDDSGETINRVVEFATKPVGYGTNRAKSRIYLTTTIPNDVTSNQVQRIRTRTKGSPDQILIFQLPQQVVATLESNEEATGISYQVYREFIVNVPSGASTVTLTTGKNNETFIASNSQTSIFIAENISNPTDPNNLEGRSIIPSDIDITQDGGRKVVYTLSSSFSSSVKMKIVVPIFVSDAIAKRKILRKGETYTTTDDQAAQQIISLGKTDVYALNSIMMGSKDVTENYTFDNGQRDNVYDISRVVLKNGRPPATSAVTFNFDYFEHSGDGDFFTVDSYTNGTEFSYGNVPSYTPTTNLGLKNVYGKQKDKEKLELRDCVDFRPAVNTSGSDASVIASVTPGVDAQNSTNFRNTSNGGNGFSPRLPVTESLFLAELLLYYLPRWDSFFLESNGNMVLSPGEPSLDPRPVGDMGSGIRLYDIYLPAYTFDISDIFIRKFNYKRYQMKDIAVIDRAVQNLTEVVALSLLEQSALNVNVRDAVTGLDRFKNGIVVDNFGTHAGGDTTLDQYRNSIDPENDILRAPYFIDQVTMEESVQTDEARTNASYKVKSGIATVDYESVQYIDNPFATRFINVQPYMVFTYRGDLVLDPPIDTFSDQNRKPALVVEDNSVYDATEGLANAMNRGGHGTVWGKWSQSGNTRRRTQTTTTINTSTARRERTSYGDRITDVQLAETMRSIPVQFRGSRLKPNTRYYAFFDDVNVTDWISIDNMRVDSDGQSLYRGTPNQFRKGFGNEIMSDSVGNIQGVFLIPNGRAPQIGAQYDGSRMASITYRTSGTSRTFNTGTKALRFTDNPDNPNDMDLILGICETDFTSSGVISDVEETIVSTRIPSFSTSTRVTDTETQQIPRPVINIITNVTNNTTVVRNPPPRRPDPDDDPVAQTFIIDTENTGAEGVFITDIDIFFRTKDSTKPVEVYLTTTDADTPTRTIIPSGHASMPSDTTLRVQCTLLDGDTTTIGAGVTVKGETSGSTGIIKSAVTFRSASNNATTNVTNNVYVVKLNNYVGEFLPGEKLVPQVSPALTDNFFIANDELIVTRLDLKKVGSGYTTATVVFSDPQLPGGTTATATAKVAGGVVYDVEMTNQGSGYTSIPSATITGDGTGAALAVKVGTGEPGVIMGVATSDDATSATRFHFPAPVFLMSENYYAFVVHASASLEYTLWTTKLGENLLGTETRMTTQPLLGSLFKSQNGGLWTPDQTMDIKFNMRRAKFFTNQTAVIGLKNAPWEPRTLKTDPIETNIDGSDLESTIFGDNPKVIRVYHSKHGHSPGDKVFIDGVISNPGGIPNESINTLHTVLSANFETFTVMVDTEATASVKDGGASVTCTYNRPYEVSNIYSGVVVHGLTSMEAFIKSTQAAGSTGYNSGNAYKVDNYVGTVLEESLYCQGAKQVANELNEAHFSTTMGDVPSMELSVVMATANDFVSPVLDLTRTNTNLVRNLVDDPQPSDDIYGPSTKTVTFTGDVSSLNLVAGNTVEFNDGTGAVTSYVKSFNSTTKKLKLSGRFANRLKASGITFTDTTLQAAGIEKVTTVSEGNYVPETNQNGSVFAKWISRLFQFENPCDGIELKLSCILYGTSDVKVYYRPRNIGFDGELSNVNWIPFNETGLANDIDKISARSSVDIDPTLIPPTDWQSLTWSAQDISKFDGLAIKIVMTAQNPALTPLIDDMQIICSE